MTQNIGIEVENWRELNRAFKQVDASIYKNLGKGIKKAAEPMRDDATNRAVSGIANLGTRWSQMRIGSTARAAYMVPKAKRRDGTGRPNLAPMLYDLAMAPAFEAHETQILHDIENLVDEAILKAGF